MFAGCRCPRCHDAVLQAKAREGCETLACRRCGGAFLSANVGLRLLAVLRPDVAPHDEDAPRAPCPVCRAPMRLVLASKAGVDVDTCGKHGVWFDGNDLAPVLRTVATELGKPVPEVVTSLEQHYASARATPPAPAPTAAPSAQWSPTVSRGRGGSLPVQAPAGSTVVGDVMTGVGDVLEVPLKIVALPFELTLTTIERLTELAN